MKTRIVLFSLFLISVLFIADAALSQTKFDDAAAMIYKQNTVFNAAAFDASDNLITARFFSKEGSYYIETGMCDENGNYTAKRLIELQNDPSDVRIKFSPSLNLIAVREAEADAVSVNVYDLASGMFVQDFDAEQPGDFFFTPDGRGLIINTVSGGVLFDIAEGDPLISYGTNYVLDMSTDGSILFCRNAQSVVYVDSRTAKPIRTLSLTNYKSIEFDERGELILCQFPNVLKLYKLLENGYVQVKEVDQVVHTPYVSKSFEYFVVDDNSLGKRAVYNLGGNSIYQSKIESYAASSGQMVFSGNDRRMALLSDKAAYVYDLEFIRYFKNIAKKLPELFTTKEQFETDRDQEFRADRVKLQKKTILENIISETKISESVIYNSRKNSLGMVEVKINSVSYYDANNETFDINIDVPATYTTYVPITTKVKVPKFQAEVFSSNWKNFKAYSLRRINDDQTGLDAFNIIIKNDLNNSVYHCIMHRTMPLFHISYDEQLEKAQKSFDIRNWYEAIVYLSDFPDNFKKFSVVEYMMTQALSSFFEEKWYVVSTMNPFKEAEQMFIYLSDFPKTAKQYPDVEKLRQQAVNTVMDNRLDKVFEYQNDKSYTDALEYLDSNVTPTYKDIYSGLELEYEYYKAKVIPARNSLLHIIGKRSMEGSNWDRAIEMFSKVTPEYEKYSEVQLLLSEAKYQKSK